MPHRLRKYSFAATLAVAISQSATAFAPATDAASAPGTAAPDRTLPTFVSGEPPHYPGAAKQSRISGTVVLAIEVTAQGTPWQVRVERSSSDGRLDRAALEQARKWRFTPALEGQVAVNSWVTVPVMFDLSGQFPVKALFVRSEG